jgi:D-tyrosyl-tRNA(Tyr) deacylase
MRAVIQRVAEATVRVDGAVVGTIGNGLLVFLGIEDADTDEDLQWLSSFFVRFQKKICPMGKGSSKGNLDFFLELF